MHGLIEHLLELHGVLSDGDMTWRGEISLLDYLSPLPTILNDYRQASLKPSIA